MKNKSSKCLFLCSWLESFDNDPTKLLSHLESLNETSINIHEVKLLDKVYQDPFSFTEINTRYFKNDDFICACKKVIGKFVSNLLEENKKYGLKSCNTLIRSIYSVVDEKCSKEERLLEKEKLEFCNAKNVLKLFNTYNVEKVLGDTAENTTSYICSTLDLYKGKFKDFEDQVDKGNIKETDKVEKVVGVFICPASFKEIPTEYFKDLDFILACKRAIIESACQHMQYSATENNVGDFSWIERACDEFKIKCEEEHKNITLEKLKKDLRNKKGQKVIDVFSKI